MIYKRLFGYVVPYWLMFLFAILGMILYAVTQPALAALMKPLMDDSFVHQDPHAIRLIPLLVIALFVVRGLAGFMSTYCINWVGRKIIKRLRSQVFHRLLILPTRFFDTSSSGMLISRLTYNIEQVAESTTNVITVIIRDTLTVIGLIGWMFYLNVILSLFMVIVGPLIAFLVRYVSTRFRSYSSRIQDSMGDVTRVAEEVITGHRIVKIFGGKTHESTRFEEVNERNRRLNMRLTAVNAGSGPVIQLIAGVGIAGVILVATMPSLLGEVVSVGTFVSFLSATLLVMPPLKHLTDVNAPLQKGIAAGESIFELLDEPEERDAGKLSLARAAGEVEYRHVCFAYSAVKGNVLHDINLQIKPGQTVAVVGRSGSGKSTLVSLLPRFYDPTKGNILLDGKSILDYKLGDLRQQYALVSQDIVLFNDTIAENIAYGMVGKVSQEAIETAAEAAHALTFINRLPEGFKTIVGDRGVLLSGGERQRIAIARALLKDAPILILDEATSALDSESERHIQEALENLMHNRTTVVIAHRLSTIEKANMIIVMDQGRIVETGSHEKLLAQGGQYAALYRMQFREEADA